VNCTSEETATVTTGLSLNHIIILKGKCLALILQPIENLHSVVRLQYLDKRSALHGRSNYEVIPQLRHLTVLYVLWGQKRATRKIELRISLLKIG